MTDSIQKRLIQLADLVDAGGISPTSAVRNLRALASELADKAIVPREPMEAHYGLPAPPEGCCRLCRQKLPEPAYPMLRASDEQ